MPFDIVYTAIHKSNRVVNNPLTCSKCFSKDTSVLCHNSFQLQFLKKGLFWNCVHNCIGIRGVAIYKWYLWWYLRNKILILPHEVPNKFRRTLVIQFSQSSFWAHKQQPFHRPSNNSSRMPLPPIFLSEVLHVVPLYRALALHLSCASGSSLLQGQQAKFVYHYQV